MRLAVSALLVALSSAVPAFADEDPGYLPGAWHFRAITCVDTMVSTVTPRLASAGQTKFTATDYQQSGVQVTFATGLGVRPLFPNDRASVTHYENTPGNDVMIAERPGDRVQVCYLGGPAPTKACNPDTDDRGRQYRVYDYAQRKQYYGSNAEHDCGGA